MTNGFRLSPSRFSEIISPQSESGGWRPRPKKLTDATRMIENVNRRPASAMIGETMFGRISRRRIASCRSPRASAAST